MMERLRLCVVMRQRRRIDVCAALKGGRASRATRPFTQLHPLFARSSGWIVICKCGDAWVRPYARGICLATVIVLSPTF